MKLTKSQEELANFVPSLILKILKDGRTKATSDGRVVQVDPTEKDIENAIKYLAAYDITKMPTGGVSDSVTQLAGAVKNYPFPTLDSDGKDAATA